MDIIQETEAKTLYKYFAFISYSSNDRVWAKKLQRSLERYRLPSRLQKAYPDVPKRAFPVFRDDTHLAGFKVWSSLMRELDNSQYLILLCSPNSAASEWVNDEVQYFIDQGKEDRILPLIIDGEPYADDPASECFPPALRDLQDPPLGVSVRALGWHKAYLKMISALLHVDYDELVMRDKRRRIRNGSLRIGAGIAAAVGLAVLLWYNTEHVKYYNAYTLCDEKPVGIYEMSRKKRTHARDYYRFTSLRGRVIRVETVNSYGVVVEPGITNAFTDYPILEYLYDDDGELITVVQRDTTGQEVSRKILTANPATHEIAVDFRSPSNRLNAQALSADLSAYVIGERSAENKSEITRLRNTYDDEGYLIWSLYQRDNLGTPACDSNGVYGKSYAYNSQGLVLRVQNLDENGQVFNCKEGWAYIEYTYDTAGNFILSEYFDAEGNKARGSAGCCSIRVTYDPNGNPIRWEALDEANQLMCTANGYAAEVCQYNDAGLLISVKYLDSSNAPVCNADLFHEVRRDYDTSGRVSACHLLGKDGQPVYSPSLSYSTMLLFRDDNGRIVEERGVDTLGKPAYDKDSGVSGHRFTYDENGYRQEMTALGQDWLPAVNKQGYVTEYSVYNGDGQLLRVEYRDALGQLTRSNDNIAVAVWTYDGFGNQTNVSYFDEQEKPCCSVEGYSSAEYVYKNGNIVSFQYFDTDGLPTVNSDYYHELRQDYDEKGNCIRCSYYDIQGDPVNLKDGYAVCELHYDSYGNVAALYYFDTEGKPACERGTEIHGKRWYYDKNGHEQRVEYLDVQGNLVESDSGYAAIEYVYDGVGRKIREAYWDKLGKPTRCSNNYAVLTYEYDSMGNIIAARAFNEKGDPSNLTAGYSIKQVTYDDGKKISERYYDAKGNPVMVNGTYHECRMDYDEKGNCIRWSYYDTQGNLFDNEESCAIIEKSYDTYGNVTAEANYTANGEPAYHFGVYKYEWEYDNRGNQIRQVLHTLHPEDEPYIIVEAEYDALGQPVAIHYFDEHGEPISSDRGVYLVTLEYDKHGNYVRRELHRIDGYKVIFVYTYDEFGNETSEEAYVVDPSGEMERVR